MTRRSYSIGLDIGGTFTDLVLLDGHGAIQVHKLLTTPDDPSRAALQGFDQLLTTTNVSISQVSLLVHSTTLVTNAVTESRGAMTGLIATRGFRDVLELRDEHRYDSYEPFLTWPDPIVPRERRLTVDERITRDGIVLKEPSTEEVTAVVSRLVGEGVEAIAICLLHSYKNPVNEQKVAEIVRRVAPRVPVVLSSEIAPVIREYDRTSTAVADAFIRPLADAYLTNMSNGLNRRGFVGRFFLMLSGGGSASVASAREYPIRLVESGPAAGAEAAGLYGRLTDSEPVLSFDMGGTTAKVCLLESGRPSIVNMLEVARTRRFMRGSGIPLAVPSVELVEIGAGGGSIARIDAMGLLKVGPDSAGASPGPACYGSGGAEPTVTDANLILGYLDPSYFLGGRMSLDVNAARAALARLGERAGMSPLSVAAGVHQVVNENMAQAARIHLQEKSVDARKVTMVAFGGAGPAHAAAIAHLIGTRRIVYPRGAGVTSALGCIAAPLSFQFTRSLVSVLDDLDWREVNSLYADMEARGRAALAGAGVEPRQIEYIREVDLRIYGQIYEITTPVPQGELDRHSIPDLRDRLARQYRRLYSRFPDDALLEAINWKLTARGPRPLVELKVPIPEHSRDALKGRRSAYLPEAGAMVEMPVYDRYLLVPSDDLRGPAIIEEQETTVFLPDGSAGRIDDYGNLVVELVAAEQKQSPRAATSAKTGRFDPAALEILWSRLNGIAEEMWNTIRRTSFSTIVSAGLDFGCAILDAEGGQVVHPASSMPHFNMALPTITRDLLRRFSGRIYPGDVFIGNDPWLCIGHIPDVAIMTPVFRSGQLVGFSSSIAHQADFGGIHGANRVREVYEEGLFLPVMKLYERGVRNESLFTIIGANVRTPELVFGDFEAQVAANELGAQRIVRLLDDYGLDDSSLLASELQGRSEQAMRAIVRALPDGRYCAEGWSDSKGQPTKIAVAVSIRGDEMVVDYAGTGKQLEAGGVNCTLAYTAADTQLVLKCLLAPGLPHNEGSTRPIKVIAPEGSILNCTFPSAVNARLWTGLYLHSVLNAALASVVGDRAQAANGLYIFPKVRGVYPNGKGYNTPLFAGGGQGGSRARDGIGGCMFPVSAANVPIEMFEAASPLMITEKEWVPDSAGAGQYRGGPAQRIKVRRLPGYVLPVRMFYTPIRGVVPASGMLGGRDGTLDIPMWNGEIIQRDSDILRDGWTVFRTDADELTLHAPSGGGYGDPHKRARDAIELDLKRGLITVERAERDYGYRIPSSPGVRAEPQDGSPRAPQR